jgi:carbonic anhydrase/acetyltransferase-like protein (isoleucine patch superfamily)
MSIEKNHAGNYPYISRTAYIHHSAILIGHVIIGKRVFVGPQAVIRADEPGADGRVAPILIEDGANVQDGVTLHALGGSELRIGRNTSLAHGVLVHGPATIGKKCFVGFNSVVFNAVLGDGSILWHEVIVEGVKVPKGLYVPSRMNVRSPRDLAPLKSADKTMIAFAKKIADTNEWLALQGAKVKQRKPARDHVCKQPCLMKI